MMRTYQLSIFALLTSVMLGCGGTSETSEPERMQIQGKVTLDGQPLDDGAITFTPPDGAVPVTSPIKAGSYAVKAQVGSNKVSISAFQVDPSIRGNDEYGRPKDNKVNYILAKYNQATTLTVEVTASQLEFDFPLSKK